MDWRQFWLRYDSYKIQIFGIWKFNFFICFNALIGSCFLLPKISGSQYNYSCKDRLQELKFFFNEWMDNGKNAFLCSLIQLSFQILVMQIYTSFFHKNFDVATEKTYTTFWITFRLSLSSWLSQNIQIHKTIFHIFHQRARCNSRQLSLSSPKFTDDFKKL